MAKVKDEKPRGRCSSYAFFLQKTREDFKKKHPNEAVNFSEFSKKCSDQWKKMSDKEKQKYIQLAEKDRKRYDKEMSTYVPPKGEKKGRKKKDPDAPKRALSAFFWYCNDERSKLGTGLDRRICDEARELGRKWNLMSAAQKAKYEALAAKDKARYEKEMAAYKEKGASEEASSKPSKGGRGKAAAKSSKTVVESSDDESEEEEQEQDEGSEEEDGEDDE